MLSFIKKSISFIVALGIVILCTACVKSNEDTNYTEGQSDTAIVQEQSKKSNTVTIETHSGCAGIYEAEPQHFSDEDINRFLSCCADSIASSQKDTGDTFIRNSGTTNSGKQFLCLESTGYHPHSVFQYIDQERYNTYSAYPIYSGEYLYETNA